MHESRRAHYRLAYPFAERPLLEVGRQTYVVLGCSEGGLSYEVPDRRVPPVGSAWEGSIRFRRGVSIQVAGLVTRTEDGIVALCLNERGIPFAEMLHEQQYLRSKGYDLTG